MEYLKNRHQGERVVLVANGPSLNHMDLRFLRQCTTIGMNKIFLGLRNFVFYPKYYVVVNEKVIRQSVEDIKGLTSVKFIGSRGWGLLPENALTHHVNTKIPPARFSHDITQGIHEGWTVTYAALQIAFYLGFQEVVIIGMDHRFTYEGEPNAASVLNGADPNHFSPAYFGGGQLWDHPDLAQSEASYRLARQEFEKDGRRIIDATLDGACTIFEKANYKEIYKVPA